jgi:NitT/TauT family transport system substrate-binding protein
MHRREFLIKSCLAGGILAGLGGCDIREPIRIGIHPWIGYESLYLAEEFGWLPASVSLIKGRAATDSVIGLVSGRLDMAALTLDEALRVHVRDTPVSVVAVMDVSAGADAVMARSTLAGEAAFRGARVAVEPSGVSSILLVKWLESEGLSRADIREVELPVDRHPDAFRKGEVDVSVSYEPVASELEAAGARRIFDSRAIPETIFDVLVVRNDVMPGNRELIRAIVAAHFRGVDHLVRGIHDALYRVAAHQRVEPSVVRRSLASITLPDASLNRAYLMPDGRINAVAGELAGLMYAKNLIPTLPDDLVLATRDYVDGAEI